MGSRSYGIRSGPWIAVPLWSERPRRRECPWFVSHFTTDGVRVNVTLVTKRRSRIQGRQQLDYKGYNKITAKCDLQRDRCGVFASVAPIPDALKHLAADLAAFLEIVGIDPGLVSVSSTASARLRQGLSAAGFLITDPVTGRGFMETRSKDYRYRSLMKHPQRFEVERRDACPL